MGQKSFRAATDAVAKDRRKMQRNLKARQNMLETSMKLLASDPTKKKESERMKSFIQRQVDARNEGHKPYFTRLITVIQVRPG